MIQCKTVFKLHWPLQYPGIRPIRSGADLTAWGMNGRFREAIRGTLFIGTMKGHCRPLAVIVSIPDRAAAHMLGLRTRIDRLPCPEIEHRRRMTIPIRLRLPNRCFLVGPRRERVSPATGSNSSLEYRSIRSRSWPRAS